MLARDLFSDPGSFQEKAQAALDAALEDPSKYRILPYPKVSTGLPQNSLSVGIKGRSVIVQAREVHEVAAYWDKSGEELRVILCADVETGICCIKLRY